LGYPVSGYCDSQVKAFIFFSPQLDLSVG